MRTIRVGIIVLVYLVLMLGLANGWAWAQTPATPGQAFAFNYITADLATFSVTRFERQVDGGAWVSVAIPPTFTDAQTPAGQTSYRVAIPALTPGDHTVSFRACNASTCGQSAPALAFRMVIEPPAPSAARVVTP